MAFRPLLRSTMMASPIGMVLAASSNQPRTWGILAASRMTAISPEAVSRTPLTDRLGSAFPPSCQAAIPNPAAAVQGARRNRAPMKMMPTAVNPASAYPMSVTSMAFLLPSGTRKSAAPDPALRQPGQQPHLPQRPGPVQADP